MHWVWFTLKQMPGRGARFMTHNIMIQLNHCNMKGKSVPSRPFMGHSTRQTKALPELTACPLSRVTSMPAYPLKKNKRCPWALWRGIDRILELGCNIKI